MQGSAHSFLQQVLLPSSLTFWVSKEDTTLFCIHMTGGLIDGEIDV